MKSKLNDKDREALKTLFACGVYTARQMPVGNENRTKIEGALEQLAPIVMQAVIGETIEGSFRNETTVSQETTRPQD